jgi:hypothetical protein
MGGHRSKRGINPTLKTLKRDIENLVRDPPEYLDRRNRPNMAFCDYSATLIQYCRSRLSIEMPLLPEIAQSGIAWSGEDIVANVDSSGQFRDFKPT